MTDEILKDEELEEVVGGTGLECIGLMTRLQAAGLAKFNTPLTQGNEAAAAKELQAYLDTFKGQDDFEATVYADDRKNVYRCCIDGGSLKFPDGSSAVEVRWGFNTNADDLIAYIRQRKGL